MLPPNPSMGMNSAPAPQGPPPASANLLGGDASLAQAGPTPEQEQAAFMAEIRDITMRITALARAHPEAAEDFEVATQSLINSMTKVIIAASTTEPSNAPNLLG